MKVFCTHGSKVDTTERLIYPPGSFPMDNVLEEEAMIQNVTREENLKAGWWPWPSDPTLVQGDGDGTVNIRSLKVRRSGVAVGARCSDRV